MTGRNLTRPTIPAHTHVIPAKAGASADGTSIQRGKAWQSPPSQSEGGANERSDVSGGCPGRGRDNTLSLTNPHSSFR